MTNALSRNISSKLTSSNAANALVIARFQKHFAVEPPLPPQRDLIRHWVPSPSHGSRCPNPFLCLEHHQQSPSWMFRALLEWDLVENVIGVRIAHRKVKFHRIQLSHCVGPALSNKVSSPLLGQLLVSSSPSE